MLAQLGVPVRTLAPLFAAFLSLRSDARYGPLAWSPEDTKKRTLEACLAVIEAMASQQPVLMVVEDLHWIDPSTLELLNLLIERIPQTRLLLLATSRPEFEPPWGDRPHISHVRLRAHEPQGERRAGRAGDRRQGAARLRSSSRSSRAPTACRCSSRSSQRPPWNPARLEPKGDRWPASGPLPALAIPASLQESLMARLDRLAPVKEVAQVAAALGRTFTRDMLAQVSRVAEAALEGALARLVDAELIYRRGIPPDAVYEFKHALVQDVAYNSLLRNKRQQLHEEIAGALVRQYPDMVETHPELLAHHYREAGLPIHAIPYATRAGDMAAARFARPRRLRTMNRR